MVCKGDVGGPGVGTGHGTATWGGEGGEPTLRPPVGLSLHPPTSRGTLAARVPREWVCPTPWQGGRWGVGGVSITRSVLTVPFCPSMGPPALGCRATVHHGRSVASWGDTPVGAS